MVVLDSDILSLMLWKGASHSTLELRLAQLPQADLFSMIVNYEEQVGGWLDSLRQARNARMSKQIEIYRRLHQQLRLYRNVRLLDFDEAAATQFQSLRKQFRRHKANNLKVASVVLTDQALLVTRNLNDFRQIPGLRSENWTKE
jgi:tRNA(fMet)-specific endonuclease VapC